MKPNAREPLAAQARSFVHANPIKSRFEVSVSLTLVFLKWLLIGSVNAKD